MPTRKPKSKRPATKEGRKLKSQVSKAKLGKRKIVEKTRTGKKKTIQRKNKPVKMVETKKVRTSRKQPNLKKAAKIGSIVGGAVGAGLAGAATKKAINNVYKSNGSPRYRSGTTMTNAKGTLPNTYKPGGQNKTYMSSRGKYTGSKSNSNRATIAGLGAVGSAFGAVAGNLTAQGIAKLKGKSKTKKQRIVNGANKTTQRQKVKSTRQRMRAKKRNIKRR